MIRLSEQEREQLDALAQQRDVSVTRLLVDGVLHTPQTYATVAARESLGPLLDELKQVRRELSAIGNNMNQMAHLANIEDRPPAAAMLEDGLAQFRAVVAQLVRLNVRLSRQARGLRDLGKQSDLPGEDRDDAGEATWWREQIDKHRAPRLASRRSE